MRGKHLLCGPVVAILLLNLICAVLPAAPATKPARKPQDLDTDHLADVPVNEREAEYYPMVDVPMPSDGVMEAGSILMLPDGRLAVGTRRGEIYLATGADATPPNPVWKLFATEQTEIFGLAWRDGEHLRHAAKRNHPHPRHEGKRKGRPLRNRQRRLGVGRRARVHVRLRLRSRRRDLDRSLPHRQLHLRPPVSRLGPAALARRPLGGDVQRTAQPRRHRVQRRRRRLLRREPGALEQRLLR